MSTIIRGIFSVFRNLLNFLYPEYIHHIGVRAAEPEVSCLAWRERAPVPQDVYVRERDMHHHRTYVPPLRIKVKAVTYPVSSVTWTFAFFVYERQPYLRFFHKSPPSRFHMHICRPETDIGSYSCDVSKNRNRKAFSDIISPVQLSRFRNVDRYYIKALQ